MRCRFTTAVTPVSVAGLEAARERGRAGSIRTRTSRFVGRAALALVALIVVAASSLPDPAIGWEDSDSFEASEAAASASADSSCVPSVESQFGALKDHPDALGFFPGASPTPSVYKHYQGIQRLPSAGVPYFFISRNNNPYMGLGGDPGPGNVVIVEFASKSSSGERIRSNRLTKGSTTTETPPPSRDRSVAYIAFDGSQFPPYAHVGGMQLLDGVLAVPLESPLASAPPLPEAMVVLVDVSNPTRPTNLQEIPINLASGAGAVALGHWPGRDTYVMIVSAKNGDVEYLEVYESSGGESGGADLRDPALLWVWRDTWRPDELIGGEWKTGFDGHQSINLIEQCDGRLYLIGTRNTEPTGLGGEDWVVLYSVSFTSQNLLELRKTASKQMYCNAESGRMCNFLAAAAPYVSPSGELILYATEHEDDGKDGSVRMAEFRHREMYRPGSPLRLPTADTGGPYSVVEGGEFELRGSAIGPEAKPWTELYEDKNFHGYSFAVDWEDRYKEDLDDLDKIETSLLNWGGGFGDQTSSVKWEAPPGCAFQLYADQDYEGDVLGLGGSGSVDDISDLDSRNFGDKAHSVGFSGTCEPAFTGHEWDLDDDGTYETQGAVVSYTATGRDGPGTATIHFRARDNWGRYVTDTAFVTIHNAAPSVTFTPPDTILEGVTGLFDLRFWDPGGDPVRVIVDWGDGTEDRYYGSLPYPIITARHEYADDVPTGTPTDPVTIHVYANDDDYATTESAHTITIHNTNPVVTINSIRNQDGDDVDAETHPTVSGERLTLNATYRDSGESDTHKARVDWGDGTTDELGTVTGSIDANHAYMQRGHFTVTVSVVDDDTGIGTAIRTVEVINNPPVARDDLRRVDNGGTVVIDCLANDEDPDGDTLGNPTIQLHPSHGTATVLPDGSVEYTNDGSSTSTDSFTYTTSDGTSDSNTATVFLNITLGGSNSAPIASPDSASVTANGTVLIDVLGNDTDPDGDTLAVVLDHAPVHGTATPATGGLIRYTNDGTPASTDTFTYRATDGELTSLPVSVDIAIVTAKPPAKPNTAVGLVDPNSGQWHLRHADNDIDTFYYGNPGDAPFLGDWDCDGEETPGLFRQSDAYAYLRNSNTQGIADIRFYFGNPSDIPLAGDFNGDGCDTLSIYRPSEARFYIINRLGENEGGLGAAEYSFLFGNPGDKPVVGDWDGDGIDEIGLHRETSGFFYYRNTLTTGIADGQFYFGDPGDRFVAGDWGVVDGVETPAMFRPSNDTFYFRHTLTQGIADSQLVWTGAGTDWLPISGNFAVDD